MSAPRRNPIQSMTGYGRGGARSPVGHVTVELRSTNHRYLEIEPRLSNGLSSLQGPLTELIRAQVRRGRVEATVSTHADHTARAVRFDAALLQRYYDALVSVKGRFGLKGPLTLEHLLALPQAISVAEEPISTEQWWRLIREAAQRAVTDLVRARQREGAKLVADLRRQMQAMRAHVAALKRRLPKAQAEQRRQLRERLRDLLGREAGGSVAQLEQAASLVRDVDVHEELVRLESHLGYMAHTLAGQPLVGKRLDFIAQELMRETNTTGAKVNDPEAAQHVVELKACIEKIREQVQNLE